MEPFWSSSKTEELKESETEREKERKKREIRARNGGMKDVDGGKGCRLKEECSSTTREKGMWGQDVGAGWGCGAGWGGGNLWRSAFGAGSESSSEPPMTDAAAAAAAVAEDGGRVGFSIFQAREKRESGEGEGEGDR